MGARIDPVSSEFIAGIPSTHNELSGTAYILVHGIGTISVAALMAKPNNSGVRDATYQLIIHRTDKHIGAQALQLVTVLELFTSLL